MNIRHLLLLAFLLAFSVIAGCSNSEIPIAPGDSLDTNSRDYTTISTYPGGHNIGSYTLTLDETASTVELIQTDRTAEKDVTGWASVVIEGYYFDAVNRNWEIDARITNHTPFTGWGCDVVFTELGNKTIVGQDGYLYIIVDGVLKRCPVIAYSKMTPQRVFPPEHSDVRKIIIHIPPDVPGLYPVEFFIDAWWPGPRHEPYVEDLMIEPIPAPGTYQITAHVRDWQTPYSTLLEVKGIIPIDGSDEPFVFTLYDDGQHGDGEYNDYIWGADFSLEAPTGKYLCIVKAWDPEDNNFENDIWFHHEGGPPQCEPIPHWTIDEGMHGNIEGEDTWVFYNEPPFADWWMWLKGPDIPPPPIFWQYHQVFGITLGDRPTTGYWIRIDEVCIDHDEDIIHVEYTEMIPGESCVELQIITYPFIAIGMMRYENIPVEFHKQEYIYECDECTPVEHWIVEEGIYSMINDPEEGMIWDQDTWEQFYYKHHPYGIPPEINFGPNGVAIIMLGDRPTTGYLVRLDEVCYDDEGMHIRYTEMIPGPGCPVGQVITQPYMFVEMPAFDMPYNFEKGEEIYECPGGECLDFELFEKGSFSGWHEKNLQVIKWPSAWYLFWGTHSKNPGSPPPPVDWEEHMVVALAMGDHPTTGFWVHLDEICWCDNKDVWMIDYTIEIPGDSCEVLQIITQPYAYYIVERADGEFIFIEHEHIYECDD